MVEPTQQLGTILVVTPTYNEAENIEPIVQRLRNALPEAHCLIVDDNSPDGTGVLADQMALADDHVHVLHRAGKGGLAGAYLAGFDWALERHYDIVIQMDADGSHEPEILPRMLEPLRQGADMVKGSRWIKGGTTDQSGSRELLSRLANIWIQVVMDFPVRDSTGGYNAYRSSVLRRIDLSDVASKGYTFQVDMTRRVLEAGGKVAEVPIHFPDRMLGESKMNGSIIAEALSKTAEWGWQRRSQQFLNTVDAVRDKISEVGEEILEDQKQTDVEETLYPEK